MTPTSLVTSLELSKRLKELGVKQESYFGYDGFGKVHDCFYFGPYYGEFLCSAFTASELGEMLPPVIGGYEDDRTHYCLQIVKDEPNDWFVRYVSHEPEKLMDGKDFHSEFLQEAMAKMLIHLLEKGIIKC